MSTSLHPSPLRVIARCAAGIATCLLVVVLDGCAGQQAKTGSGSAAVEAEAKTVMASIDIDAPNWRKNSSPFIVHFKGIDDVTGSIDFYHAVSAGDTESATVELETGRYEVSYVSAINPDGSISIGAAKLIRDAYENLKFKLGRIPSIKDFVENGSIDPIKIIDKFGSYYAFLSKYEKDYENKGSLNKEQELMLEWLGQKYAKGKRRDELCLIEDLVAKAQKDQNSSFTYDHWVNAVAAQKSFRTTQAKLRCNAKQLSGQFNGKKHEELAFIRFDTDNQCHLDPNFLNWIKSNGVFKEAIEEVIQFGLNRYQSQYSESYKDTDFVLYEKYTYEDVQRLLGWSRNMNAQNIGGYFYDKETKTLPVFINYEKAEDAIAYEDRFISPTELIALSKHPRSKDSPDADHMFKRTEADKDNRIYLFVRKNKDDNEAKEFYFLGEMVARGEPEEVTMPASNDKAFEVHYVLDVPVRHDIYEYITEG